MPVTLVFSLFVLVALGGVFATAAFAGQSLDRFRRFHPKMALMAFAASSGYVLGVCNALDALPLFAAQASIAALLTGSVLCAIAGASFGIALRLALGYAVRALTRRSSPLRSAGLVQL